MGHPKARVKISTTLALLAILLSFLSQVTPLWVSQSDGTPIVICSSFGTKTIIIDENGQQVPDTPSFNIDHCQMCLNASMAAIAGQGYHDDLIPPPAQMKNAKPFEDLRFSSRYLAAINGIRAPPAHA